MDQVGRIQQRIAAIALVAPGLFEAAMRAGSEHIAVGEEAPICRRPDLPNLAFINQTGGQQPMIEMLRQGMVLRRRGTSEMVE